MSDDNIMTLYVNILKWYSNRTHSHKIAGTYYDKAYGTQKIEDVRRLCKMVENVDIEFVFTITNHLTLNITLNAYISDPITL